jgi:hypothetical protein
MEQNLSYNEREALAAIQKTGSYSSTRHNDRTKALEGLIREGYPIKREVVNKALMVFTWQAPAHTIAAGMEVTANVGSEVVTGRVTGFGEHKGKQVIDLDNGRFVYHSQVVTTRVLSEGDQHFLKTWGNRGHICLDGSFKIFSFICLLFLGAAFASCSSQPKEKLCLECSPAVNYGNSTGWKISKITSHAYGVYGYYYTKGDSIRYIQSSFNTVEVDTKWDCMLYGKNLVSR